MNLSTADELRVIYRKPGAGAAGKSRTSIDEASARFIGRAPLVMLVDGERRRPLRRLAARWAARVRHRARRHPRRDPRSRWQQPSRLAPERGREPAGRPAVPRPRPRRHVAHQRPGHHHHRRRRPRPPPPRPAPTEIGARRRDPRVVRPLRQGVPAQSGVATRDVGGARRRARSGRDRRLPVRDRRPRGAARTTSSRTTSPSLAADRAEA